jgi:hypothetical protein
MRTLPKAIGAFALVLIGTLASGAAMAQHHGHGFGGGHVRFGVSLGFPIFAPGFYPYYPYPYAYPYGYPAYSYAYPSAVVGAYSAPSYVEQGATQAAPAQAQGDWYYCAASRSYYPYVTECAAGWQRVPSQPPSR